MLNHGNLFDSLPRAEAPEELLPLVRGRNTRIERIVSQGHASPPNFWYDQEEHEYVLLLEGEAELELQAGGSMTLGPGDWLAIPAGVRHRVAWTHPERTTIWLAVFYT